MVAHFSVCPPFAKPARNGSLTGSGMLVGDLSDEKLHEYDMEIQTEVFSAS